MDDKQTTADPQPVTLGSILQKNEQGELPKALTDFQDTVIPGANLEDEAHKEFHGKLASMGKAYADTKNMVGGMIKIPGKDAKPEEIAAFRQKLGVPESADKYDMQLPTTEDKRLLISKDNFKNFMDGAHKAGMSNEHVKYAVEFQADMVKNQIAALDAQANEGKKALKEKYGDKYEENMAGAERMVKKYFGDDAQKGIATGIGIIPDIQRPVNIKKKCSSFNHCSCVCCAVKKRSVLPIHPYAP